MNLKRLFLPLVVLFGLTGFVAGALTTNTIATSSITQSIKPSQSDTSYSYSIGVEAIIQYNNQNTTVTNTTGGINAGPSINGISLAYDVGLGLGAETYTAGYVNVSDPSTIIVPTRTVTVTNTTTETQTYTTTITKTVTGPGGETTVITEVQTVTIPQKSKPWAGIDPKIAGAGALAALVLLFLWARR